MRVNERIFYGKSDSMVQLKRLIETCARSDASVLILGDTGVGKEVISRELHLQSPRCNGPLVPINCAAIPSALLESELFGYTKGSFTGALTDRPGRFQLANGGTLFLDEIGDMPLELQAKMLRVLEERVVEPIGGGEAKPIDVRIIAATHRDLDRMVQENHFRQDLYYRLNVLPLHIPPVRNRKADILTLCQFFIRKHSQKNKPISFTPESARILLAYDWPGNVREISNLMMRFSVLFAGEKIDITQIASYLLPVGLRDIIEQIPLATLADSDLTDLELDEMLLAEEPPEHMEQEELSLPEEMSLSEDQHSDAISSITIEHVLRLTNSIPVIPDEGIKAKQVMANIEIRLITAALCKSKGSVSQAAQLLHMQRTTLIQKIARYNIATAFL
jgi:sigma-54 specific flagellar transcriptional regulator A